MRGLDKSDVVIKQLEEQITDYEKDLNKANGLVKKLRGCLSVIAEKICDGQYGKMQLGGINKLSSLNDLELRDFIIENTLQQKVNYTNSIKDLQQKCILFSNEKDRISIQLLETQKKLEECQLAYDNLVKIRKEENLKKLTQEIQNSEEIENSTQEMISEDIKSSEDIKEKKEQTINETANNVEKPTVTNNSATTNKNNAVVNTVVKKNKQSLPKDKENKINRNQEKKYDTKKSTNNINDKNTNIKPKPNPNIKIDTKVELAYNNNGDAVDINAVMKKITTAEQMLLTLMGETGLNEATEIKIAATEQLNIKDTQTNDILKSLNNRGLIEEEKFNFAVRRNTSSYYLNNIGKKVYEKLMGRLPIKDERDTLVGMHASLEHGYTIKTVKKLLEDMAYHNVCMDSSKNMVKLQNGTSYIPDITAYQDDKTKTYWEVELGHHHDDEMSKKLLKAAKMTTKLYVVVDKNDSKDILKKQIEKTKIALRKRSEVIDFTVVLGTVNELKRRSPFFDNPENQFKF